MTLRHTGRDGADTDLGDQLHADARGGVRVLQVEDQLRQVFDRIDVVMRRWADEAHAGSRMARRGDDLIDLVTGEFASLTRLGSLRNLDL